MVSGIRWINVGMRSIFGHMMAQEGCCGSMGMWWFSGDVVRHWEVGWFNGHVMFQWACSGSMGMWQLFINVVAQVVCVGSIGKWLFRGDVMTMCIFGGSEGG
jgi:hypothetical protein